VASDGDRRKKSTVCGRLFSTRAPPERQAAPLCLCPSDTQA
jgi:hypothetical protein